MSGPGAAGGSMTSALERLLGGESVMPADALALWTVGGAKPLAGALPSSVEEVRAVLALAAS
ncbi:MAG TPA: hypothetical protein VLA43_18980, partial [Longimicrobiales bacterium]|nr:hypothetical protein [Longimicrobiales bacterium]